jgi:predicted peptidase
MRLLQSSLIGLVLWLTVAAALAIDGSVQHITFNGPVTGNPVHFSLYLPPGYAGSTNRYPLIIHLHGINGVHNGGHTNLLPASHEAAVDAGLIEPCLIAFPDGYGDSFWADSTNSTKPAETNVRSEIIPYLDANYRTASTRNRRVIQGFSMGGFGAAKFATKFPELFCACVIYDGAMLTWTQVQQRHAIQAAEIFGNSAATFDQYSPWYWLNQRSDTLRTNLPFRDAVGALLTENRAWKAALDAEDIDSSYIETGEPHLLGPLLDAEGSNSWAFIADAFRQADGLGGFRLHVNGEGNDVRLRWPSQTNEQFRIESTATLPAAEWQLLITNLPAAPGAETQFVVTNALAGSKGFYRVSRGTNSTPGTFSFNWDGTNFTYSDAQRSFSGIMIKPPGNGPFAGVVINHGAGGTVTGYSLGKAREMSPWGIVAIGPTLTHVAGGETNPANMGNCAENIARGDACLNVLASLSYIDTNRLALFGHSMGGFATIGQAAASGSKIRAAAISAAGVIPDSAGTTNAAPTVTESNPVNKPFLMFHCDADPVVPAVRSQLFAQLLNTNSVVNNRILFSSNSIPNTNFWHNLHQEPNVNTNMLTNIFGWFKTHGVLP